MTLLPGMILCLKNSKVKLRILQVEPSIKAVRVSDRTGMALDETETLDFGIEEAWLIRNCFEIEEEAEEDFY